MGGNETHTLPRAECCSPCLHTLPMAWLAWSTTLPVGLWPHPQATIAFACVALAVPLPLPPGRTAPPPRQRDGGGAVPVRTVGSIHASTPDCSPNAPANAPTRSGTRRSLRPPSSCKSLWATRSRCPTWPPCRGATGARAALCPIPPPSPHTPSSLGPPSPPGSSPAPRTTTSMCTTRAVCVCCKSSTSRRPRSACRWR